MSRIVAHDPRSGLTLAVFTGPAEPDPDERLRIQLTTLNGRWLQLDPSEWRGLVYLASQIGNDIDQAPELETRPLPGSAAAAEAFRAVQGDD